MRENSGWQGALTASAGYMITVILKIMNSVRREGKGDCCDMTKLLVLYDSQTGKTEKMAKAVVEGARSVAGVDVDLKYYAEPKELAEADALVVGAPTYYHDITLPIKQMLEEAAKAEVQLKGKIGAAVGSYGWSGEAPRNVLEILKNRFGMKTIEPPITALYEPKQAQLDECKELGKSIAQQILGK